jgi:hypothetical protein
MKLAQLSEVMLDVEVLESELASQLQKQQGYNP